MDNVLRPALIKRGADLPLLLIFAGVIGGLLAFGLVGLLRRAGGAGRGLHAAAAWIKAGEASPPPADVP